MRSGQESRFNVAVLEPVLLENHKKTSAFLSKNWMQDPKNVESQTSSILLPSPWYHRVCPVHVMRKMLTHKNLHDTSANKLRFHHSSSLKMLTPPICHSYMRQKKTCVFWFRQPKLCN